MTIQKLKNYRYICRRVRQLEDELNDAEEIDRTAGSQSNFPYIKQSVKISGVPDMYIEKKNELSILKAQKMEIERFIKCIPDKQTKDMFYYKYGKGMSWIQISILAGGGNSEDSCRKRVYRYLKNYKHF